MKKIVLSFLIGVVAVNANAQTPDFGFETWANVPLSSTIQDPVGWASFNALVIAGMPQTVFKETAAPYVGTAAAKIVTDVIPSSVMIPNPFKPSEDLDTVGLLVTGKTQVSTTAPVIFGKPFSSTPSSLSFAYKYNPVIGDSGFVVVYLTKWTGSARDTVARGSFATGNQVLSWTSDTVHLTWDMPITAPDSQHVYVSSSIYRSYGAKVGSTFYIDDVAWEGTVGVDEIDGTNAVLTMYPNPVNDKVTFKSSADVAKIRIVDITGRLVYESDIDNNKIVIDTYGLSSGLYIYTISNDKKQPVHTGKFEVTK